MLGLRSPWVIFYTVLASTGVVGIWVFQLLNVGDGGESVMQDAMRPVLVLRVMWLLRVVCALRLLRRFKTLYTLAGALWMSRDAVGATFVLVALAQKVAACLALEVITNNPRLQTAEEVISVNHEYLPSLGMTMLTLTQSASGGLDSNTNPHMEPHRGCDGQTQPATFGGSRKPCPLLAE